MNKKFFSLFGLAMVLSIAIHLASPSTMRAAQEEELVYFFAEESTGTPIPKASWELVGDTPITLNLWVDMSAWRNDFDGFATTWDISYSYSGGITAGDLNIEKNIATSGDWYEAMGGNWSDSSSGSDSATWTGEVPAWEGDSFGNNYFLLGSMTLSASESSHLTGGVFTMSNRASATQMYYTPMVESNNSSERSNNALVASSDDGFESIPTSFITTTVTVAAPSVPEPGTWAMLAGAALVGGAWMRRRKNIAVR